MSVNIKKLMKLWPDGTIMTSSKLKELGYSFELQKQYRESGWLTSIGSGAMKKMGDKVEYLAGINALQSQLHLKVHPGGRTALALQGKAHYLELGTATVFIFGDYGVRLPKWFQNYGWESDISYDTTQFLPYEIGLTEYDFSNITVHISSPERAILECLYLTPAKQDLMECLALMEGLNNLRPNLVQKLLENCKSIKVKRLFFYLADKCGHFWFSYLKPEKIDLGTGVRSMGKTGKYVEKYQIIVPPELEHRE